MTLRCSSGRLRKLLQDVAVEQLLLLHGLKAQDILVRFIDGQVSTASGRLPEVVDGQIMKDSEHPGPGVSLVTPLMPAADRSFQTILHQIVGGRAIPDQGACVSSQ